MKEEALNGKYWVSNADLPPNMIQFSNQSDWIMRITPDRKIEVNENVEVTEASKVVLAMVEELLLTKGKL